MLQAPTLFLARASGRTWPAAGLSDADSVTGQLRLLTSYLLLSVLWLSE